MVLQRLVVDVVVVVVVVDNDDAALATDAMEHNVVHEFIKTLAESHVRSGHVAVAFACVHWFWCLPSADSTAEECLYVWVVCGVYCCCDDGWRG